MVNQMTEVRLLSVPLENDYQHTLYFGEPFQQYAYFEGQTKFAMRNVSYQRKDGFIRWPLSYDELTGVNYLMYTNMEDANNSKTYYGFITEKKYVNDGMTEIHFEIDVLQTYMFDYVVKASFVEREHVDDDTPGNYIQEENIQIGEYKPAVYHQFYLGSPDYIVVGVSKVYTTNDKWETLYNCYNGVYSGITYRAFENTEAGRKKLAQMINFYDEKSHGDDVQCMFYAPAYVIDNYEVTYPLSIVNDADTFGGWINITNKPYTHYINPTASDRESQGIGQNYSVNTFLHKDSEGNYLIDTHKVRNKKLLTYPYMYLLVSNNQGIAVPYRFEDFYGKQESANDLCDPQFVIDMTLCPGTSARLVPYHYKGLVRYEDDGINLGKLPALNWSSDLYTNWLTQNSVNIGLEIGTNVVMTALGIAGIIAAPATGGATLGITAVAAGASGIAGVSSTISEVYKASKMPAQVKGNVNAGDVVTASYKNDFHFYTMTIKREFAEIVDDYFDMYGYKVCKVKVPNVNHRRSHWYTKTVNVSIDGNIPMKDLQIIKNCYNNGITFWQDASSIGDYSKPNDIMN